MYAGIDLAADAKRTGLAMVSGEVSSVISVAQLGADDDAVVDAIAMANRAGIDVPLGWPDEFVRFIQAHASGDTERPERADTRWRRRLAMRVTDEDVYGRTGLTPLSVSTDRIAHPAMRWSSLEARLRDRGVDVARDGSGVVCEIYPAGALRCWSLPHRGYKGAKNIATRAELVAALSQRFTELDWNGYEDSCIADDNILDAVIAALMAREVAHGRAVPPPDDVQKTARREGWIWLPQKSA